MNQILISRGQDSWLATFLGPASLTITSYFGEVTLPTAFPACTEAETVRAKIQACNPDFEVVVLSGVQQ